MKIKVCGMKYSDNLKALCALKPDYIGFIFYERSPRSISEVPVLEFPETLKKAGVFVNASQEYIIDKIKQYDLQAVQLHGSETPEFCEQLSIRNEQLGCQLEVIKAFSVDDNFDFSETGAYSACCDLYVFDTKGKSHGGTGVKFNWDVLDRYKGKVPYLLSGGIRVKDVDAIKQFLKKEANAHCIGVDINSGFEIQPGLKNIEEIKEFKQSLQ